MSTSHDADALFDAEEQTGLETSENQNTEDLLDSRDESKSNLIEKFERCSFCNSKLLFTHELNLSYFQIMEAARCPGCGVTPKTKKFTLH